MPTSTQRSDSGTSTNAAPAGTTGRDAPLLARNRVLDVVIMVSYLLISIGLYRDLWRGLPVSYLVDSGEDQNLFEWFFAVQAHALAAGHPTLVSALQNHPVGVNLMANTAMPGLALPLAPLTLLAGPTATWALVLTGGLAGTAAGWYWLYSRHLVRSRWSAAVGGACCAFTPPVISHAHAHPNFTAMFLLPVIVLWLVRLRVATENGRRVKIGVLLGLLIAWQVMIGEEPLLILATGLVVYALAWAVVRPRTLLASARSLVTGLGVAAAVAIPLVGYPLWVQFTGPSSYRALRHGMAGNDLTVFGALPKQSVGGQLLSPEQVVANPTEQNAFFGWPLLVLLLVAMVWLWREVPARLATITLLVMAALSAGGHAVVNGQDTGIPGPWLLLHQLPLYESLIEARLTFACLPVIGMLLALASDRVLVRPPRPVLPGAWLRWLTSRRLWFAALVLALLPILPVRFITTTRADTPALFSSGAWRDYVRPGRAIVTVPLPDTSNAHALHWQVVAGLEFPIAEGYFVGPFGPAREGTYGAERRPTSWLLAETAISGAVPAIGPEQRAAAIDDLRYWRADAVVLAAAPNAAALRATLDQLLGPGQDRDDVVVWDVRSVTG
ncbi:hypothetical protein [Pseudonocardia acaciae]|uniref:hypothetical protein n=1 Tax=Pseudonocardia acaciae TaxID=551276 RepID=UPI00048C809D|nr:hypothetical protein [Pseudonocardia acaciae]